MTMDNKIHYEFYKKNKTDKIWWIDDYIIEEGIIEPINGSLLFSFDKKKIYNAWTDYPYKLTKEEKDIFDKENPYWRDFFKNK